MDRTRDVLRTIVEWAGAGRPFCAAVVLEAEGSTPREAGARAAIDASGTIAGTVGGGAVEEEVTRRAAAAARTGAAEVVAAALTGSDPGAPVPICGGRVRVLIDPGAAREPGPYAEALGALDRRERGLLVTSLRGSPPAVSAAWVPGTAADRPCGFPPPGALRECLARETARLFRDAGAALEVLAEPIVPEPRLLIAGGGHIGRALAAAAGALGFEVNVVDDRPEFADPARFPPGTAVRCGDIGGEVARFPIGPDTHVVIVTRGHRQDAAALAACIRSPAASIGMIGSRRKVALMREEMVASGRAAAEEFDRILAPIGLDIGAVTVPEIAASIAAQLVAVRRKGAAAARAGGMPRS